MKKTTLTLSLTALALTTAACMAEVDQINGMTIDEAIDDCQSRITKKLTSPASADFADKDELDIQKKENDGEYWQIRGYVDSDNKFGASLRSSWYCTVRPRVDDAPLVHINVKQGR
ncbi:hypothetical protein [Corynebacterium accolens]|jgi:lipoprotein|uniref:hypothetical protein n=1 Tax=Corynebacterium accolens TaxID=38284 RepID=UPI00254DC749|nr:hypothetical protein [Corynebacterium accolens]MDK8504975.1 hypothetical protein [Corynebacterium accolens]MDK8662529.1 hypothetical protein [Corynebacterium accolens]